MTNRTSVRRFRFWLWLIALIGVIVPRRLRADWKQEWKAELQHREALLAEWDNLNPKTKLNLLWRSLGAFWDALLLQPQRLEDELFQDLRYGARMLLKHKGFTILAVLSLALGIGANTSLFSIADAVLLRTLPVNEPDRLVLFEWQAGKAFRTKGMSGTSYVSGPPGTRGLSLFHPEVFKKMQQAQAQSPESPLSDLFAFAPMRELTATVGQRAEIIGGQAVSGGYYQGLGLQPILGRGIADEDDKPGAAPVVVLTHEFWRDRFDASPTIIGQQLKLNKQSFTIIGVTPPGFIGTLQVDFRPSVTIPLASEPLLRGQRDAAGAAESDVWWLDLMGRLKSGATLEQARDSLDGTFESAALQLMPPPRKESEPAQLDPKDYPRLMAESGSRGMLDMRRWYSATITGLFIIVAAVLLIACANVANLLLARAALRGQEIGVRLAVGAGRWRLIRQLLTESVLLAALGGGAGILFAFWGKSALLFLSDKNVSFLPGEVDFSLNWRVLMFTVLTSVLTGMLFGLAPAWRATKLDFATTLKQGRRTTGVVSRLSKALIVAQVALSLLLLVGAGLFIRTLTNLQRVDLGFNKENLLLFKLQPGQAGYKDERLVQFYQQLFTRMDGLPGVRSATFATVALIADNNWLNSVLLPGETENSAAEHDTNRQAVRENYFATMEIPQLKGRGFTSNDTERFPQVAIVNQAFARKFFPNEDVLGKHVSILRLSGNREVELIGVVADSKYMSQRQEIGPLLYTPWQQEKANIDEMSFTVRTEGEPTALAGTVQQVVREMDSDLPVTAITTQEARARATIGQERLYARLLSFFGVVALLLAVIGLSGVLAYSVAQRTNEIGIRMALGAQARDVLRLVTWQGMKLVALGLAVGVLSAYVLTRLLAGNFFDADAWQRRMAGQLYGVNGSDPLTIAAIAALLLLAALAACWLPARKAAKVDPMVALRHE
jgi:predicted permease